MVYFETYAYPEHLLIGDKEEYVKSMRKAGIQRMVVAPITHESNYWSMELFSR